jgi:hypothetical protein
MQLLVYYCKQQKLPTDRPLPAEHRAVFNKLCGEYLRRNPQVNPRNSSACSTSSLKDGDNAQSLVGGCAAGRAPDAPASAGTVPAVCSTRPTAQSTVQMELHKGLHGEGEQKHGRPDQVGQRGTCGHSSIDVSLDGRSGASIRSGLDGRSSIGLCSGLYADSGLDSRNGLDSRSSVAAGGSRGHGREDAWPRNGKLQESSVPRPRPIPGYKHLQGITHTGDRVDYSWQGAPGGLPVSGVVAYGTPVPASSVYPPQWAPTAGHLVLQGAGERSTGGSPMASAVCQAPEPTMLAVPYDNRAVGLQSLYAPAQMGPAAGAFSGGTIGQSGVLGVAAMGAVHSGYGRYMVAQPHVQVQHGQAFVGGMPSQQAGAAALHHVHQYEQPQALYWHGAQR